LQPENLLIGNGSIELIYLIPEALTPHRVLIAIPTFSEYELSARQQGSKIIFVKRNGEDGFGIEVEKLVRLLPRSGLVFLCNPNNPTGNLISKDEIIHLAKAARRQDSIVVADEAFIEFIEDEEAFSVVREAAKLPNLLALRSLTKFFALPGLRLGYMVGNKNLIAKLSGYQFPWNINCFAQLPTANFIFCRLDGVRLDSGRLCDRLGRCGILVRDCSNFRGLDDKYIRIAVRKRGENEMLITELQKILGRKVDN